MKSFELKGNQWFLNGDITFKEILSVHEQAESYAWKDSVVLNLKGVEELDTSLLSFILEQRRQAKKFGKVLRVQNPPPSLISLSKLYGIERFI